MKRSLIAVTMLSLVALAGCADESGGADEDDFSDDIDLQATSDTGVIRGVVVDPSIVPVPEADVVVLGQDMQTKTNAEGAFGFSNVPPGSYFLEVSKIGYNTTQSSVSVEAGVDKPPVLKVQVQPDASSVPYFESFQFHGFLECSVTAGIGGNICGFAETATGEPVDEPLTVHELAGQPDFLQSELIWDNTQPLGGELRLFYSWDDEACDPFLCDIGAAGTSPVVLRVGEEQIDSIGFGREHDLMVRVFNQGLSETDGLVGFTFEQKFTVFTHAFYGFQPDEAYLFIEDGPPQAPQE